MTINVKDNNELRDLLKPCKIEDFADILDVFKQDAEPKRITAKIDYSMINRLFLESDYDDSGENNELMLRLNTYHKQLVVARIRFINKRQGYGHKFLQTLQEYGQKYGYKEIVFESVLTDAMKDFLVKNNFQIASNQEYEMNWKRPIPSKNQ